jgi:hypothetical protein
MPLIVFCEGRRSLVVWCDIIKMDFIRNRVGGVGTEQWRALVHVEMTVEVL